LVALGCLLDAEKRRWAGRVGFFIAKVGKGENAKLGAVEKIWVGWQDGAWMEIWVTGKWQTKK
jgi:hypothetical protein